MRKPKAVLFDLDDTLLAFSNASERAWASCCESFIASNTVAFTLSELLKSLYKTRKWYWSDPERHKKGRDNLQLARREVFEYTLEGLNFHDIEKTNAIADSYTKLQESLWSLFDGTADALQALKNLDIRMAVVTNGTSETQRNKLKRFGIFDYFDCLIIDTEVGFSKPDVRIFEIALEKLSLAPSDVWMIGDNLVWDVEAPQKLGIFSVWHDYKQEGLPVKNTIKPDMIVHCVYEMSQYLTVL